jgi:GNAT superfamily N-acetyltransferase
MSTQLHQPPESAPRKTRAEVRQPSPADRDALVELVARDGLFTKDEVEVALELIDAALTEPGGEYRVLVADVDGKLAGYVCYGPTPMTEGTWDLYWIATHPDARGGGVARALVERMESELRGFGARLIRVETSQQESYGAAHKFYERMGYPCAARLPGFYKPGDDLLILLKLLK